MEETRYLIVGGGLTGDAACRGIRDVDGEGRIVLVGAEPHAPYSRPPLSKALWQGKDESSIWRGTEELGVELALGRRIVSLDPTAHEARDDQGETYRYERLLLATGGQPRRLPGGGDDEVVYFRTLDDFRRLRSLADGHGSFVVIGGGFIGSEIAAALVTNGCTVTMVFPEDGIGARIFPPTVSAALNDYYRDRGVDVRAGALVSGIDGTRVTLGDGTTLEADGIVAGLGIVPNEELAATAGLPVGNGIVVDAFGRVDARDDVFAAGDVANFPIAALGTEVRVEHEDHAKSHGRRVGANMAGELQPYDHLPFFYSDLFELGYEAVGELDSRLEARGDWSDVDAKTTIWYVDGEGRPRGALTWNTFGALDEARERIVAGDPVDAQPLATP
jgi:3-phenylpropionate/trans-cinnamate dioxygenase ferredoxin reductase component